MLHDDYIVIFKLFLKQMHPILTRLSTATRMYIIIIYGKFITCNSDSFMWYPVKQTM